MPEAAIRAEGLGKRYRIGGARAPYRTLREDLSAAFRGRRAQGTDDASREVWALKDVSFGVAPGEVLGVIGRNGAGKSTLLKILSRITAPSEGRAEIRGRVGSLLEVGTGFHPELTGRENVYLSGAILGMRRAEILRRFDEIVAFAEVERFVDTPVKHYSSGMYLRLAFAVAAHLEPEVLLVDEVLAVGDAQFQQKCLGKMREVAKGGRTILFVSHSIAAVTRLCSRVILLDGGRVKLDGDPYEVTGRYLQSDTGTSAEREWTDDATAPGDDVVRLRSLRVLSGGRLTDTCDIRQPITIELQYWNRKPGAMLLTVVAFYDDAGNMLFLSADFDGRNGTAAPRPAGLYRARCEAPGNLFAEGTVRVLAEVSTRSPMYRIHAMEPDAASFRVVDSGEAGSVRAGWSRPIPGIVRPMLTWSIEPLTAPVPGPG